jgi:hypothetical protein
VEQRIREAVMQAEHEAGQKLKEAYAAKVASTIEKRMELATILRGQKQTVKTVVRYNKPLDCVSKPSISEVLRAIAMDNKLEDTCKRKISGGFF